MTRYPPDLPSPVRAIRCLMTPPPRSASICPLSARSVASKTTVSEILSFRAYRWNHLEDEDPYTWHGSLRLLNYSTQCDTSVSFGLSRPTSVLEAEALGKTKRDAGPDDRVGAHLIPAHPRDPASVGREKDTLTP